MANYSFFFVAFPPFVPLKVGADKREKVVLVKSEGTSIFVMGKSGSDQRAIEENGDWMRVCRKREGKKQIGTVETTKGARDLPMEIRLAKTCRYLSIHGVRCRLSGIFFS